MTSVRKARLLLLLLVLAVLGGWALPHVTGAGWGQAWQLIRSLQPWQLGFLVSLWAFGLWAHAFVATAALPGLTHRQAVVLNMSGSAVVNAVPLGGTLAMGLKYRMVRSWGFAGEAFAALTAVCSALGLAVKLALPVAALGLLLGSGGLVAPGLRWIALAAVVLLGLLAGAVMFLLLSSRALAATARAVQRAVNTCLARLGRSQSYELERHLLAARDRIVLITRLDGRRLVTASLAHALLQAVLFAAILAMLGSTLGPAQVFAGFAFGRVLTLVGLTPGGIGIAETGSASLLLALGGDPSVVAAGLIVFGAFTYLLPIPLGGLCVLRWRRERARSERLPAADRGRLPVLH